MLVKALFTLGIQAREIKDFSLRIMGFPVLDSWSSYKYLGMPITMNHYPYPSWDPLLDEFELKFYHEGV